MPLVLLLLLLLLRWVLLLVEMVVLKPVVVGSELGGRNVEDVMDGARGVSVGGGERWHHRSIPSPSRPSSRGVWRWERNVCKMPRGKSLLSMHAVVR